MEEVLLFSITAMANPTLIAVTTVMLLLPNPKKLMLGYLIGAYVISISLGLVIVFAAKDSGVVKAGKQTINPAIDLVFGAILLGIALLLHRGTDRHVRERRAERKHERDLRKGREEKDKVPAWQRAISKGDPKLAVVVGAVLTLPGASYLAALTNIAKLNYSTVVTVLVVLMVNLIMLALLEVPLVSFFVAPDWTPAAIARAKAWAGREGRHVAVIVAAVLGWLLILRAVITLIAAS
jgi:Sap, sulfolipid-1-addressing protein